MTEAARRLQNELSQLLSSNTDGEISAFPSSTSLLHWIATITGPSQSPYEKLRFKLSLDFSSDYPYQPPEIKFISKIFHPNIDLSNGVICLDILKENWSAVYNINSILLSIQSLLADPNNLSPLNIKAAELWVTNKTEFNRMVVSCYKFE